MSGDGTFHMHVRFLHIDRVKSIGRLERMAARHLAIGSSADDPPVYGGCLAEFAYCESNREKIMAQGFRKDETDKIRNTE